MHAAEKASGEHHDLVEVCFEQLMPAIEQVHFSVRQIAEIYSSVLP